MEFWKIKDGIDHKWDVDKENSEEFKMQSVIVVMTVKLIGKNYIALATNDQHFSRHKANFLYLLSSRTLNHVLIFSS